MSRNEDHHRQGRRFAAGGNGHDGRDPRDVEIERLRQRVCELEIQHEIRQIRKRIRELELQREMRKETKSRSVVWDDVNEEEEYPSFDSYPRFFEPIYPYFFPEDEPKFDEDEVDIEEGDGYKFQETDSESFIRDENYETEEYPGSCSTLYSSHPCFDCYGDEEVSNEDYWWVTRALNVVVAQEGGTVQEEITGGSLEGAKVSIGILNDFVMGEKTEIGGVNDLVPLVANGDTVASGSAPVVKIGDWVAKSTAKDVVFPCIEPRIMDELNVCSVKEEGKEMVSQMGGLVSGEEHSGPDMIQGDVPYDPGGCGSDLCSQACENSRTSFFEEGENDVDRDF
ncbi:hypothetical protein Tco_0216823 [Tanacetum coccineum]